MTVFLLGAVLELQDNIDVINPLHPERGDIALPVGHVHRYVRIVHLLHETAEVETHYFVDPTERILPSRRHRPAVEHATLPVQQYLLLENAGFLAERRPIAAQSHHLRIDLGAGNEVHPLLQFAASAIANLYRGLFVIVFVDKAVGEVETHQVLDSVLHHIADYQDNKEWQRNVPIPDLGGPADPCRENHGHACGNAVVELLDSHAVLLLVKADVEIALDVFLEKAVTVNHIPVVHRVGGE